MKALKRLLRKPVKDHKGVALFMVISAVGVLALLVSEFTYISQLNQKMAYDRLDQLSAFYTAKSAYKLSLLRIKAYQHAKGALKKLGGQAGAALPQSMLDQIWSFPLIFPLPTSLPGMTKSQAETFQKFEKESGIKGQFTAIIESESSKYNLNLLLAPFAPKEAKKKKKKKSSSSNSNNSNNSSNSNSQSSSQNKPKKPKEEEKFDPEVARKSLFDYMLKVLEAKAQADENFASEYRNFRLEDLMENIYSWVDKKYESRSSISFEAIPPKGAPFYSLSELNMIPGMDDNLFELFSPTLTANMTPGINVNTMKEATLRALLAEITDEEVKEFFEFRDDPKEDNKFKDVKAFTDYLQRHIAIMRSDDDVKEFQDSLKKRNIRLVVEESSFTITVRSTMNTAVRTIRAAVILEDTPAAQQKQPNQNQPNSPPAQPNQPPPLSGPGGAGTQKKGNGFRVTHWSIE